MAGSRGQRRDRRLLAVDREHARAARQRQREGADAAEQVGDALGLAGGGDHQPHHLGLRFRRHLHEGPRRRLDAGASDDERRPRTLDDGLAVNGNAGDAVVCREAGQLAGDPGAEARPAAVRSHIETDGRDQHGETNFAPGEQGRNRAQPGEPGDDGRLQHRALLEREQLVAAAAVIAENDRPRFPASP